MTSDAPSLPATPVVELDEVDSTNLEALRRAAAGERGPVWLLAGRQTAGRGRAGRSWQSQAGNLAATLLIAPGCAPAKLHELSLLTGVCVLDAVLPLYRAGKAPGSGAPRLKWPNDILAGSAKLGGILIESTIIGGEAFAAIGIGLNVAQAPVIAGRETAAIGDWGATPSPHELLGRIDVGLRQWLAVWQHGVGFEVVRGAWLERAGPVGEAIIVNTGTETISGAFVGIDETGALLVDSPFMNPVDKRRFTFGDVSLSPHQAEG